MLPETFSSEGGFLRVLKDSFSLYIVISMVHFVFCPLCFADVARSGIHRACVPVLQTQSVLNDCKIETCRVGVQVHA